MTSDKSYCEECGEELDENEEEYCKQCSAVLFEDDFDFDCDEVSCLETGD